MFAVSQNPERSMPPGRKTFTARVRFRYACLAYLPQGEGMMKKLLAGCAIAVLAAVASASAWAQQSFKMRLQTAVPAAADEFKMLQKFSQRVDAMTNGRLKVEV